VLRGISIPFISQEKCPSPDCDGIVDKASKQKGIPTVIGNVQCRNRSKRKKEIITLFLWEVRVERIATHRMYLGRTMEGLHVLSGRGTIVSTANYMLCCNLTLKAGAFNVQSKHPRG